jgi:alpha-2-macroglobulin
MTRTLEGLGRFAGIAVAAVLLGSCAPLPAPRVASGGESTAAPPADEVLPEAPELAVVHHGPEGEVTTVAAVTAVFNQPMVALTTAAEPHPLTVEPPLHGDFRWISGDTLKLELRERPRHATEYTVRIPAGTASVAGKRLAREVVWRFATPRPALLRVDVPDGHLCGQEVVRPGLRLDFSFNQPVAAAEVQRHLRLLVNGAETAFRTALGSRRGHPDLVAVTPTSPFPRGAHVAWELRPGYRGQEGPREARAPAKGELGKTPALGATISCADAEPLAGAAPGGDAPATPRPQRCWPMAPGVEVRFTAPVRLDELLRSVEASVTVRGQTRRLAAAAWEPTLVCTEPGSKTQWARGIAVKTELALHARYDVRVRAGVPDVFGRTSAKPERLEFQTRGYPPGLFLPREGERGGDADASESEYVLEAPRRYAVRAVNVRTLALTSVALAGRDLVRYLECNRAQDDPKDPEAWDGPKEARTRRPCLLRPGLGLQPTRRTVAARAAEDRVTQVELPLLPPGRRGGVVAFQLSSPEVVDHERRPLTHERVVSLSALNVHARLTPYDLVAWVTGFGDGRPVAGAQVQVLDATGAVLSTGTTGPSGFVQLPGFIDLPAAQRSNVVPRLYVLASRGTDLAYAEPHRHSGDVDGIGAMARQRDTTANTWEGPGPKLVGYAATERGIYRPGEEVHVYAIAREHARGAQRGLARTALDLRVSTPAGAVLQSAVVTTDDFGAALWRVELPANAGLGTYTLELAARGDRLTRHRFQVQQYRPPRFEVTLRGPRRGVLAGEPVTLTLGGRFFSGGPTARAAYQHVVTRDVTSISFPKLTDYHIGADLYRGPTAGAKGELGRGTGRLDDAGGATLTVTPRAGEAWHPLRYFVEAEVRDQTQSTVADEESFVVHPAARYVAVRRVVEPGAPFDRVALRLLVVDTAGAPQAGETVTLAVHPRPVRPGGSSWRDRELEPIDFTRVLEQRTVTVPLDGAALAFSYPLAEPRVSVVLSVRDAQGRVSRTDLHLYRPSRPAPDRPAPPPPHTEPEPLTIQLDQECYEVGATAVATVRRRVRLASATLFVQRERTFAALPLDFRGGPTAQVRFPVSEQHVGGVDVRVVAYPAGAPRAKGKPVLPLGASASLCVSDASLRLGVEVRPRQRSYRPGKPATVELTVTDAAGRGREAAVVLMAVDESVLRLTRFSLHDPYRSLNYVPSSQVTLDELRAYLMPLGIPVEHIDHAGLVMLGSASGYGSGYGRGMGGIGSRGAGVVGGRQPRDKARRLFLTTALFRLVRTDPSGRAQVTFPLPDNLTEFRVMAVAFDRERRAGTGVAMVATEQPLALVAALPRLARVGDRFAGGVVVYNNDLPAGAAHVSLSATGLATPGPTTATVRVGKGLSEEARFALRADRPGRATLRFEVRLGDQRDALEHELTIEPVRTPEARAVAGVTESAARHQIDPLGGVQGDYGGLEVSMSSSALSGVAEGLDQLIRYPYGCMEQKSSQLLPMLGAITLGSRLGAKLPGDPRELSRRALADILAMQLDNGGFTLWPGGRDAYPWLTAYALVVFHRAAAAGVPVHADNVARATRYLAKQLEERRGADLATLGQQALMVYGLALHGVDVTEPAARLFTARHELPTFGRAMLLAALGRQAGATGALTPLHAAARPTPLHAAARPTPATPAARPGAAAAPARAVPPTMKQMIGTLTRELGNALAFEGSYAWATESHDADRLAALMSSNDRTTAMVLLALLQARPEHPAVPRLAYYLVGGRRDASQRPVARFRNTQEAAWSLMALGDFAAIVERAPTDYTATVSLGSRPLLSERFVGPAAAPRARAVPMAELQAALGRASQQLLFRKQGSGRLYYSARLRYSGKDPAAPPVSRGFTVARRLVLLDDAGEEVAAQRPPRLGEVVLVRVTVQSTQSRRFVVVDDPLPAGVEAIDTGLATASRLSTRAADSTRPGRRGHYDHREVRDDRVVHFTDALGPGEHVYEYLGRVVATGVQAWPAARAEEMYSPEVYGTSGGATFEAR